jgi:hypothetical protein
MAQFNEIGGSACSNPPDVPRLMKLERRVKYFFKFEFHLGFAGRVKNGPAFFSVRQAVNGIIKEVF